MPITDTQARRKEYPELAQDKVTKLTDVFFYEFRDPYTKKITMKTVKFFGKVSKMDATSILKIEDRIGGKPSAVYRGLYFYKKTADGPWIEVKASKQDPAVKEECTDEYKKWRKDAYRSTEDPFEGQEAEKLDPNEKTVSALRKQVALLQGKENEANMPAKLTDTSTGKEYDPANRVAAPQVDGVESVSFSTGEAGTIVQ